MANSNKGRGRHRDGKPGTIGPSQDSGGWWNEDPFEKLEKVSGAQQAPSGGGGGLRPLVEDFLRSVETRTSDVLNKLQSNGPSDYNVAVPVIERNELTALLDLVEAKLQASPSLRSRFESSALMRPYIESSIHTPDDNKARLVKLLDAVAAEISADPQLGQTFREHAINRVRQSAETAKALTPAALWADQPRRRGAHYVSPSSFILAQYGEPYHAGNLGIDDVEAVDPDLAAAYRRRIRNAPSERLEKLHRRSSIEKRLTEIEPYVSREEIMRLGFALAKKIRRAKGLAQN